MGKREMHLGDLIPLFRDAREASQPAALFEYLLAHSALPGPRSNLELLAAFGDAVAQLADPESAPWLWSLCSTMAGMPPADAPVDTAAVFLPLCGTVGLGHLGAHAIAYLQPALARLRELAHDPRWRMREAVCFALQELLRYAPAETVSALGTWVAGADPLEMRAVAAALADPPLLQNPQLAEAALALHRDILERFVRIADRKREAFRVLRQGLAYTLSVVVKALPDQGFPWLRTLLESADPDVLWVVRQNLQKNRLVKAFPAEVAGLLALAAP